MALVGEWAIGRVCKCVCVWGGGGGGGGQKVISPLALILGKDWGRVGPCHMDLWTGG